MRWNLATIVLVPRGATAHADHAARQRAFQWAAGVGFESTRRLEFLKQLQRKEAVSTAKKGSAA